MTNNIDDSADKKIRETLDKLKESIKELDNFEDNLREGLKDIKYTESNTDIATMGKEIDKIWKASKDGTLYGHNTNDSDDTAYMEGTDLYDMEESFPHADEEYDYYVSDTIKEIWDIVKDTPNDMELGKKIRQLYFSTTEATPDTIEKAANEMKKDNTPTQMEIDFGDTEQLELFDDTDD